MSQEQIMRQSEFELIISKLESTIPEYMIRGNIIKPEFRPYGDNTYFIEYKTDEEINEKQNYIRIMATMVEEQTPEKNNEYYLRISISVSKPSEIQRRSIAGIMDKIGMDKIPNRIVEEGHYTYSKSFCNNKKLEEYWSSLRESLEVPLFQ